MPSAVAARICTTAPGRAIPRDDSGQEVPDEGREPEARGDETEDHRQTETGGDGGDEVHFVWHGRILFTYTRPP